MRLKTIMLAVMLAPLAASYAQDKIYKTDGSIIDVKVKTVGPKTVTYARFDNQAGPEYTLVKREITKVVYQNGNEDVFEVAHMRGPRRPGPRRKSSAGEAVPSEKLVYGRNIAAISPFTFTENGIGFSLSYERTLDRSGIVAFYMPVATTFNLTNGTYYNYSTGMDENRHQDMMFYVMPGVKIYPTGSHGKVRYAVGPSLVWATGEKTNYNSVSSVSPTYTTGQHSLLGMVVMNSVNFNPNEHIYVGLEMGLGFAYFNRVDGLNERSNGLVNGAFRIGYRF